MSNSSFNILRTFIELNAIELTYRGSGKKEQSH